MSESLQPGLHPDPDTLSAFIEGVLPEHERVQCMAHLAECAACREVVYLAQEPVAAEAASVVTAAVVAAPEEVPFWRRWFRPIPVLTFATAAGTLLLSFSLYEHLRSIPQAPAIVAIANPATRPPAPESAPQAERQIAAKSLPEVRMLPRVPKPAAPAPAKSMPEQSETASAPAADAFTVNGAITAPATAPPAAPIATFASPVAAPPASPAKPAPTGVAGTITDPAGGPIPGAAVTLRPLTSPASKDLTSDPKGRFNVAGLEPGPYEMQVTARGFKQMRTQVEIQPNQIARADSILQVGSVSETVSVTAASAAVQTTTGNRAGFASGGGGGGRGGRGGGSGGALPTSGRSMLALNQVPGLALDASIGSLSPNKAPAATMITKGKVMLRVDSAGALFLSDNAGKKWKAVKPVWPGKVTGLILLTSSVSSDPSFQLTVDGGASWLSRDGSHWYVAPK